MYRATASVAAGLIAALLISVPGYANRYVERRPFPTVSVSGEASIRATPEVAEITAGVTNEAKTPREAAEANASTMNGVIAAIRDVGIADSDIRTTRYVVAPVYASKGRGDAQHVTGYRMSNYVRIRIANLDRTIELLDRMIAAGATNISCVEFSPSNPTALRDKARADAFADARRRAELYAKAAGGNLGRAISIQEHDAASPQSMGLRAAAQPSAPIMPGEDVLSVMVTVTFELMP
jgi:uncharacterized protein YggE